MTVRLLLDEHYASTIADALRAAGHDATAVVADPDLRGQPDPEIFRVAAASGRRVVTENARDFRPLQQQAYANGDPGAALLLVPPGRFPRGRGDRAAAIADALVRWLSEPRVRDRAEEEWLV